MSKMYGMDPDDAKGPAAWKHRLLGVSFGTPSETNWMLVRACNLEKI
jgi:hypothetical protein